ncbi:MAG: TPM domain-containing protein [Phycisphaerae bacterium]
MRLTLWLIGLAATAAPAAVPLPAVPSTHVADLAGVLDAGAAARADDWLTRLEQATAAQVVVLTVPTLDGEPVEEFAVRVFAAWKLGQKGHDNGVLVCIAVKDRKYRIEVGYGLEGVMPDGWCGDVGREMFVPAFRRGRYGEGILAGAAAIATRIAQSAGVDLGGVPQRSVTAPARRRKGTSPAVSFLVFVIVALILSARASARRNCVVRRRFGFWDAIWLGQMLSGGRSRRGWSGGSSSWSNWGGGGGSFGGGGGGSSGGGGASGGW